MIITLFINIYSFLVGLINFLPNFKIPDDTMEAVNLVIGYVTAFDGIIPIILIMKVIALSLFIEMTLWFTRIVVSVVNWVRGSGGIDI